jgi:GNAT superfamily N-acetyltransferase
MKGEETAALEPQLANCRDYWLGWGVQDRADDTLTYYRSGLPHGSLNGVLRLQSTEQMGRWVERAGRCLAGVPWLWWVGPDSARDLGVRLVDHGAVRVGAMPVMAVRTDRFAEAAGPPALRWETVDGVEALTEWVAAYMPSFGFAPRLLDDIVRCEAERRDAADVVRVTGRLGGEAVGTALMFKAHGVAGVYVVTTAMAHRRQGIGAALTTAALKAGRARGARIATLQASGSGVPVYRRMGFQTIAEYQLYQLP